MAKSVKSGRAGRSGTFVLGALKSGRICAVEGIRPSKRLQEDLERLKGCSSERRRTILAAKYSATK